MANALGDPPARGVPWQPSTVRVLVLAKADVNKAAKDGTTPAGAAAGGNHVDALRVLVQSKVDVNQATRAGEPLLAWRLASAARLGYCCRRRR
jgi:hypothetical protein